MDVGGTVTESHALNEDDENHEKRTRLTSSVCSDYIDIFLKVLFVLLSIPALISIVFFSIYDTQCIIFHHASVINCSQTFFTSNPEHWVFSWLFMSAISSFIFLLIVFRNYNKLNYQLEKARKIYTKGSFGSLIFLLVMTLVYYAVRIHATKHTGPIRVGTSILVLLWLPVKFVVVCCFNYLPRVRWQKTSLQNYTLEWFKQSLVKNSNFIIYWLSLFLYFVEVACKLASIMLDVALEVAPLIDNNFPDESVQMRGVMVIVIGFRLAFHLSLVTFFWEKIFHGEADLFSEPDANLLEKSSFVEDEHKSSKVPLQEEDIPLDEMNRA